MTRPSNTLSGVLLLFCILKVIGDEYILSDVPEIPSEKDDFNYLKIIPRRGKTVGRALNEGVKASISTPMPFIEDFVAKNNEYRSKHSSPPLEIDYQLCLVAEGHAKVLAQQSRTANRITVKGSGANGEMTLGGQNIAMVTGKFCAEHWYAESNHHNWTNNIFNAKTAHFTQMIWKSSTSVGVAQVNLPSDGTNINVTIVVARYFPPGNWNYRSSFATNVTKAP